MALNKKKLGDYIERVERRNSDLNFGADDVRGISNNKEIQPTKADISDRSFARFQIVEPHEFVFNRRTTRMGDKLGLGYNNISETFIVTEDYVVFRVKDETVLLPDYLNIFFRRPEFDRYARWDS
jgi:type I restriction enzyme S subunit